MLGLHHTKKGGAEDPLEALSGSNGLSACADTTLVLDSDQNGKTLYVRGRDVEEKETALIFAGGFWTIVGEAADVRRSVERNQIITALQEYGEPMTPAELSTATGKTSLSVRQLLFKMAKAGEVYKAGKGRYWLEPLNPHNNDNADNDTSLTDGKSQDNAADAVTGADEPITHSDNATTTFDPRIYNGPEGDATRRKCSHCGERGDTLKIWHGMANPWLHRECIEAWTASYEERAGGE